MCLQGLQTFVRGLAVYLGEHFVLKVCVIDTGESVRERHGGGVERRRWMNEDNGDRQEAMATAIGKRRAAALE
jgi:hypothetical protein